MEKIDLVRKQNGISSRLEDMYEDFTKSGEYGVGSVACAIVRELGKPENLYINMVGQFSYDVLFYAAQHGAIVETCGGTFSQGKIERLGTTPIEFSTATLEVGEQKIQCTVAGLYQEHNVVALIYLLAYITKISFLEIANFIYNGEIPEDINLLLKKHIIH